MSKKKKPPLSLQKPQSYADLASGLRDLRKAHRLTVEQAAGKIDVSAATWSRWENAIHVPTREHLRRIAEEFGFNPDDFTDRILHLAEEMRGQESINNGTVEDSTGPQFTMNVGPYEISLMDDNSLLVNGKVRVYPNNS